MGLSVLLDVKSGEYYCTYTSHESIGFKVLGITYRLNSLESQINISSSASTAR